MDPISLIVAALTAGAVAGAQGTATDAVKDAYAALKSALQRRFGGRASAEVALTQHAGRPDAWTPALEAELVQVRAGSDPDIVDAARRMMELIDEAGAAAGKYSVDLRGAQGVQAGDHNIQHNTFTVPPQTRD